MGYSTLSLRAMVPRLSHNALICQYQELTRLLVAEQVRRWMGEHFEPKEVDTEKVTEKIEQTESVKQVDKARSSLREGARQSIEQHRQQRQQPRHSRGIGH